MSANEELEYMIKSQLADRGISSEKVLNAFHRVDRKIFVPASNRLSSYEDRPLSIGNSQTISQPYMVAVMTEKLDIKKTDTVLEIGTGSGYQTAILAELAGKVVTVERIKTLFERAGKLLLEKLGYTNINMRFGDGTVGVPELAPYDKIIVTAANEKVPPPYFKQIVPGGLIEIPAGDAFLQNLELWSKDKNGEAFLVERSIGCRFVKLYGRYGW